ncbi:MAG: class I SAM-dependent methyltransferase [Bdellovibrionaceae bacterium]|nr:class I SAM-dependent methyltransferase [Pseudobdellovibrionaceae bacterium]
MSQEPIAYSGTSLLESMESAVNYNSHIADIVSKYCTGKNILDFGAGNGTFARLLTKRLIPVQCLEPDLFLRERLQAEGFTSYASLQEAPHKFDCIYTINVLEHIENDPLAVREMHSALKPKGIVVAYVPAFMSLYSSVDKKIGHHRRYTAESLAALFKDYKIIRCEYVDSLGYFAGLAFKALDKGSGNVSESSIRIYDQFAFPVSKMLDVGLRHLFGKNVLLVAEKQ